MTTTAAAEANPRHVREDLARRHKAAKELYLELCRRDVNTFCEYVLEDEETGARFQQEHHHVEMQARFDRHKRVVYRTFPESGKRLAADTEIPTPTGWRRMDSLVPGDVVFGGDGAPCSVRYASPVLAGRMFEVKFADGAVLVADGDHLWKVRTDAGRHTGDNDRVVSTDEMVSAGLRGSDGRWRWRVPVAGAAQTSDVDLPLDPYVLGAWLGDGSSRAASLTFGARDRFVWDRCVALVGGREPVERKPGVFLGTLGARWGSVRASLRALGVLGQKRIPESYLGAGTAQRRELLAGLLDTDGSCGERSRVELTLCSDGLARDALQLVRSLGFKASVSESDSVLRGRVVGRRWRIAFTANEPVFRLPRKLEKQGPAAATRQRWNAVVSIKPVSSVPALCIAVDSPDHTYLAGRAYTVTHNTNQMGVGRVLWALGRNPRLRVCLLGNDQKSAIKVLKSIRGYIERSTRLREVFPHLRRGDLWQDHQITVKRPGFSKDPSIQAIGYHGSIQGARIDLLIVDDLLDHEVTRTEVQRQQLSKWFRGTVMARLTAGALVCFLCNAWHPRDLSYELVEERGWHLYELPSVLEDGTITWPLKWSAARLEKERKENLGELEFSRLHKLKCRDDAEMIFKEDVLKACSDHAQHLSLIRSLPVVPARCVVVTGVDLGGKRRKGGETALVTTLIHPNADRQILCVEAGRWGGGEIIRRVCSAGERFGGVVAVESNGLQVHLMDLARESGLTCVPIVPFYTGKNKVDPRFGVASMAVEFEGRRWLVPLDGDGDAALQVKTLVAEMVTFVPELHTGDRLMALWIAREVARRIWEKLYGVDSEEGSVGARVLG